MIKSIKFNQLEQNLLKDILQEKSFSKYVKVLLFKKQPKYKRLEVAKESARAYNDMAIQLKRIGNNLNQISKRCNTQKSVDFFMLKEISAIKDKMDRLCDDCKIF